MNIYEVSATITVEADDHGQAVSLVSDMVKEKNANLIHVERKKQRMDLKSINGSKDVRKF